MVYQSESHVNTWLGIEAPKIVVTLEGYFNLLKIGKSGIVHVYRCIQNPLQRPAAIKLLINELSSDAKARKRFERESYIIARLNLANIIRVINRGSTEDEISYFVMQFVEGIDLGTATKSRQFGHCQKVDINVKILKALASAHRNNVIHRDIRPDNILADDDENVKEKGTHLIAKEKVRGNSGYEAMSLLASVAHPNIVSTLGSLRNDDFFELVQ